MTEQTKHEMKHERKGKRVSPVRKGEKKVWECRRFLQSSSQGAGTIPTKRYHNPSRKILERKRKIRRKRRKIGGEI